MVVHAGLGASHRVCLGLSVVPFHLLRFDDQRVWMRWDAFIVQVVICVVGSDAGTRFEAEESAGALVSSSSAFGSGARWGSEVGEEGRRRDGGECGESR